MQRIDTLQLTRRRYKRLLHILSTNVLTSGTRTVINVCKVFDFCASLLCLVCCLFMFLSPSFHICVSHVGRDVIRACVSIMPREYQCYDNSFNSIASKSCLARMVSGKMFQRMTDLWGPQYKRYYCIRSELTLAVILSRKIPQQ